MLFNNADMPTDPTAAVPIIRIDFGGADPTTTTGAKILPGGSFTADRQLPTPVRIKADVADTPISCYMSTTDGRNIVADIGFDRILSRNSTILTSSWDTPLRAFYASTMPIIAKSVFFYVFVGPDNLLALENWASDDAAAPVVSGSGKTLADFIRDSKQGYQFAGNTLGARLDTGKLLAGTALGQDNFSLGFASALTTPASNSATQHISNGLMQISNRTTGLLTRANATSTDTWNTQTSHTGLMVMTRREAADYDAYANGETHTWTQASTGVGSHEFKIGCAVNNSDGTITASSYVTENMRFAFLSTALSPSEITNLKAAVDTLVTAISGL
jgi:hypothetical protein